MPITDWDLVNCAERYECRYIIKSEHVIAFFNSMQKAHFEGNESVTIETSYLFIGMDAPRTPVKSITVTRPYVIIETGRQ